MLKKLTFLWILFFTYNTFSITWNWLPNFGIQNTILRFLPFGHKAQLPKGRLKPKISYEFKEIYGEEAKVTETIRAKEINEYYYEQWKKGEQDKQKLRDVNLHEIHFLLANELEVECITKAIIKEQNITEVEVQKICDLENSIRKYLFYNRYIDELKKGSHINTAMHPLDFNAVYLGALDIIKNSKKYSIDSLERAALSRIGNHIEIITVR